MIVLTGNDSDDMAQQTMQLGVQDYVVKGRYDAGLLLRRIRFAVQRNRQMALLHVQQQESFLSASRDQTTGLPNRELFEDRANSALAQSERTGIEFGIVFINLDGFKGMTDDQGQPLGDVVVRRAGKLLAESVRKSDTVAYIGDYEFAIALVPTDANFDAGTVARRFHEVLRKLDFEPVTIIDSIGVASFPQHGDTLAVLIENSEQAMYRAKRAGGGVVIWDPRAIPIVKAEKLPAEAKSGDLVLEPLFQPWVDLRDSRYAGVEVLLSSGDQAELRLASREQKRSSSYDLLSRLCQQLRSWRDEGLALPVLSFNLDEVLVEQPDLLTFLVAQLEAFGLSPLDIRFEVPASVFADGSPDHISRLRELRDRGFPIVIDQFLTSADGFLPLTTMPLDGLKICRDVLATLPTDRLGGSVRRIVAAAIGAATGLGIDVIASGVETAAMRQTLRSLGCRYLQGDLLCEPLPAAALPARWREGPAALTLH
jgi:diguanylate cyclase (GGDEF)-like protein